MYYCLCDQCNDNRAQDGFGEAIQGVNGKLYPCKPDMFFKTYEKAEGGAEESNGKLQEFYLS